MEGNRRKRLYGLRSKPASRVDSSDKRKLHMYVIILCMYFYSRQMGAVGGVSEEQLSLPDKDGRASAVPASQVACEEVTINNNNRRSNEVIGPTGSQVEAD